MSEPYPNNLVFLFPEIVEGYDDELDVPRTKDVDDRSSRTLTSSPCPFPQMK